MAGKKKVYPSGFSFMAMRAATMPPAPALLSTTAGWPHLSPKGLVTNRADVSTGPPAGKGTMKLTARAGHAASAAHAVENGAVKASAPRPKLASASRRVIFFMIYLQLYIVILGFRG